MSDNFEKKSHLGFLKHMLRVLPTGYSGQDSNRTMLIYFTVGSLDLLNALDEGVKKEVIDYIYTLQTLPDKDEPNKFHTCGFRGGTYFGKQYNPQCTPTNAYEFDHSHIAMTYCALVTLRICGDDFSRVNKAAIVSSLKHLQLADGSFCPTYGASENDMRFVYCAAAISYLLDDWSGVDVDKAVQYILSSQSYDHAIGQGPGQESHGGSTYCAVAALYLMGRLDDLPEKEGLKQWCVERHQNGFQGRINKIPDTCYSFWIGASLKLLGGTDLINYDYVQSHSFNCQTKTGGFGKWPDTYPDVLHTYMALCGLSIGNVLTNELPEIDCGLGISKRHCAGLPPIKRRTSINSN